MEENWRGERKFNENKLMLRQAGVGVLVIILFFQYYKVAAYLSNRYFFDNYLMSIFILLLGIPLSYFVAKFIVWLIKSTIKE
ncbi:hypothetical protein CQS04_05175 [Chryseomicrobium excrementi]|uniref:Uncharacterized protein n=1 Tax=Chryseomicrobium excrementi TaxID=2041346 RepID=A0A2M9EZC1_9BACL|nr:hypothetical protein [Chryseomicrobium excrementi]PJK16553.1 hypothetical protein CQS04_05175 [Chryseomicrobium excrementi]